MKTGFVAWCVRNPVAANLLMMLVMASGLVMLPRIRREVFPEFPADLIHVRVPYPGATPQEVEESICVKVEEAIQGVDGIEKISSNASEGSGLVVVKLLEGTDASRALDDIKARVDAIDTFPEDAEEPVVSEVVLRRQVLSVAVSGPLDARGLRAAAERVRDDLNALPHVTLAELVNVRPYEISIEVREDSLRRFGLSFDQVAEAVRKSSLDLPGGSVRTSSGEILLRTRAQAYRGEEFEKLVVLSKPDGSRVHLGEVAEVVDDFAETDQDTRFDGESAVLVNVFRVGDQDAIVIADEVKAYCASPPSWIPEGVKIAPWFDQSQILKSRQELLVRNGISGFLLVFVVLALFLRFKLAIWVTLGIPMSFLGAMAFMPSLGASFNLISLFAFILVLGIVVDDAIVVGENVYAHSKRGKKPLDAAIDGAQEVALPVTFSVLTTVVAFLPLFGVPGLFGRFMSLIPMVVVPVLLFSLVESKTVLPVHLRHFDANAEVRGPARWWRRFQDLFANGLEFVAQRLYRPSVGFALRWRWVSLATAATVLILSITALATGHVKRTFFPEIEGDNVIATITFPQGTPVETTLAALDRAERAAMQMQSELDARREPGAPSPIRHILTSIGDQPFRRVQEESGGRIQSATYSGARYGEINLELAPSEDRSVTSAEIGQRWRELVGEIPGTQELNFTASFIRSGAEIDVSLRMQDLDQLRRAAERLQVELASIDGLIEIGDSFDLGKEEVVFGIRPEAEALGLDTRELARQVRQGFFGEEAQRVQRGRDDVRVMVRYPREQRRSLEDVETMRIRTRDGTELPFLAVADADLGRSYSSIRRSDRSRAINVTANVDEDKAGRSADEIAREIDAAILPRLASEFPGLRWAFEGEREDQAKTFGGLGRGFLLALLLMYVLMAIPFRSYVQPFIVMLSIPFGLIGAILGHIVLGYPISLMSMFGLIALAGVVVNDAIVLVDFINKHRRDESELLLAVREAGVRRFRPILLTSLTTFAGLTPLLLEKSVQAKFLIPMAISLGFGVMFATFITLVLIPCAYLALYDLKQAWAWIYRRPMRLADDADDGGGDVDEPRLDAPEPVR
jgi:multidrug efflux pump subunit AcrB